MTKYGITNPVRVCVVDEHPLIWSGIRTLFQDIKRVHIVGCVKDGADLFVNELYKKCDIVITDIEQNQNDGIRTINRIKEERLPIHVLVYTANDTTEVFQTAMGQGARGFILKSDRVELLLSAIDTIIAGNYGISPTLSPIISAKEKLDPAYADITNSLSRREKEIVTHLADGKRVSAK